MMRSPFRTLLAALLLAGGFALFAGCDSGGLKLGLKEDEVRVMRLELAAPGVPSANRRVLSLAVDDNLIVQARALSATGTPVRNEAVAFASNDEERLRVLATWGSWPDYFAALRGVAKGTAEVICTAAAVSDRITVAVGDAVAAATRPFIRFLAPDGDPIPVGASRVFTAEFVDETGAVSPTASLVFTLSSDAIARIDSSTRTTVTVTGLATGEVNLFARDAANSAGAGISLSVR